jgi:hypothetical protein
MNTNMGPGSRLEYDGAYDIQEDDQLLWQQMEEECNNDEGE